MAYKIYSKNELKTLLQQTQQEVVSKLLNPFDQNNQLYYQNFANISIKIFKHVNNFLNQINSDQILGKLIDSILKNLTQSLNQYKSRNIFTSTLTQGSEHQYEEDEIYHFMNTRNSNIPFECLNNYESQKQRIELQQFVQEMSKHTKINIKQPKRSLILPKNNNIKMKIGRKASFDTELRSIQQEMIESKKYVPFQQSQQQEQITVNHVQIQTDFTNICLEQKRTKTVEPDTECQCDSLPVFQKNSYSLSFRKDQLHKKKKKQSKKDPKGKKQTKTTNNPSSISFKENIQDFNEYQKQYKERYPSKISSSLKSVNFLLNISKEVDITLMNSQIIDKVQQQNSPMTPSADEECIIKDKNMFFDDEFSQNKADTVQKYQNTIQIQQNNQQHISQAHQNSSQVLQIQRQISLLKQKQQAISVQISKNQLSQQQKAKPSMFFDEKKITKNDEISSQTSKKYNQNQRTPSPTVKIVEIYQLQQKTQQNNQNQAFQLIQKIKNQSKITKKKKIFASSLNFHSSIKAQNDAQHIKNIDSMKKSSLNTIPAPIIYKNRKENNRQNHKYSILSKYSVSNLFQIPSQQYLISPQKSAQKQLKNPNQEILNNQTKDKQPNIKKKRVDFQKQRKILQRNKNSFIFSGQIPSLNKEHYQTDDNTMMVFFSKNAKQMESNQKQQRISLIQGQKDRYSSNFHKQILIAVKGMQSNRNNGFSSVDETYKTPQNMNISQRSLIKLIKNREKQCKTVDPATELPKRSIFDHKSSTITPVKASIFNLKKESRQLYSSRSRHKKIMYGKSQHHDSYNFEFNELKRKLRDLTNKEKIIQYLDLIQATHLKFCGKNCEHVSKLLKENEGSLIQQIIRLFKRIK